ncbi:solute carrier family 23 protein [Streptomyces yaanensis]|uniref:Solute carrier family 23 protein n=1 Tax=Streptomyces yaanensis TaxID=1142239 RepID=A0ABV7SAQ3_9ACTN|nr:solute carrier family 23 protein [Streptomyces sp. CGMCC 4.7035]WNC03329.1 solute carrier family 23 protein [Streptomyces sp. CGMCC 4.7035]
MRGFLQRISILLGLLVGPLAAIPLAEVDLHALSSLPVFELPHPFAFGAPRFEAASIISMLVVMVVSMTESTADMIALGEVVERPVDLNAGSNAIIVAVSLAFGIFPIAFPGFYHAFPEQVATVLSSGISAGWLLAITLNLLFNHLGKGREVPQA